MTTSPEHRLQPDPVEEELVHESFGDEGVVLTPASSVRPESVRWLSETPPIPLGHLSLVVGMPGLGKSTILTELSARASRGQLVGDLDADPVDVVIATAEDHLASVVVPRLLAAGADLDRVHFVAVRRDGLTMALTLPDDLTALERKMESVGGRLLILDPLVAHLPISVDGHKDQHIRRVLAPLARLAEERDAATCGVVHLNKGLSTDVLTRISGSIGLPAAARSVLMVARDPEDPDGPDRILAHVKSNLGPEAPAFRYRIEERDVELHEQTINTSGVVMLGEAEGVHGRDLLAPPPQEDRTVRDDARDFLLGTLELGPRPTKEVMAEGRRLGYSERTLERARGELHIRSEAHRDADGRVVGWNLRRPLSTPPGGNGGLEGGGLGLEPETAGHDGQSSSDSPPHRHTPESGGVDSQEAQALAQLKSKGLLPPTTREYIETLRGDGLGDETVAIMLTTGGYPPPPGAASWTGHLVRLEHGDLGEVG